MDEELLRVCYMGKIESEIFIVNACSLEKSESKIVHISINTNKVKYAMNEPRDEEPLGTDNSVINSPGYFKLFKCG